MLGSRGPCPNGTYKSVFSSDLPKKRFSSESGRERWLYRGAKSWGISWKLNRILSFRIERGEFSCLWQDSVKVTDEAKCTWHIWETGLLGMVRRQEGGICLCIGWDGGKDEAWIQFAKGLECSDFNLPPT